MTRAISFLICLLFSISEISVAQNIVASIKSVPGFKRDDFATSYFDSVSNTYHLNLQNKNEISRQLYDTNFNLISNYTIESAKISFSERAIQKTHFLAPLCTSKGTYEIFSDQDDILIYKIDFDAKKDSLVAQFKFDKKKPVEKIISLLPDKEDLKILTYNNDNGYLRVYKWSPGMATETFQFDTPVTNLSQEEEKKYGKAVQIKLKTIGPASPIKINSTQTLPRGSGIYYDSDRIYMLMGIPYSMGVYVMSIDLAKNQFESHNYFINSFEVNSGSINYLKKHLVASIFDSTLVIQNSSHYRFEYLFYDLTTNELIKKHSVQVEDSIYKLVHSDLIQKGSFASSNEEKEIKREKAFMRKIDDSFSYMTLSSINKDSIIFTLAALEITQTAFGTLLSLATLPVGVMANIHIGNLQIIPYLTSYRYKFLYAHSKFNTRTFEASKNNTVETLLDKILDTFKMRDLSSNSSFFFQKKEEAFIGIYNKDADKFDIYKFQNTNN